LHQLHQDGKFSLYLLPVYALYKKLVRPVQHPSQGRSLTTIRQGEVKC
jgi:hypothetical protein